MVGGLLGRYRVIERLGEGGTGVVYVGRHEALGYRVAVKMLRPELSSNTDVVRRFFNEALAATAIRHASIVQVFDSGMTRDGQAYYMMELLEGETLTQRIQERWLDSIECCRIGRQIANALQAAHMADIIHRDLKPDSLFLVPDAEVAGGTRVKVLDFGLAKLGIELRTAGLHTRADLAMGTPSYMAPEQYRGVDEVDPRSDIYALGCNLFEMMCGRPPFVGHDLGEILGAHQFVAAPDLRRYVPTVAPALAALVARMLEKQPEARPQTMAAVSQALAEILCSLDGTPVHSSGPRPIASSTPPKSDATPPRTPTLETSPASSQPTTLLEASPALPPEQVTTMPRAFGLVTTLPWSALKASRPRPVLAITGPDRPPTETQNVPVPIAPLPMPSRAPLPRYYPTPTPARAQISPSIPPLSEPSTTLGASAGMAIVEDRPSRRRLPLLLGIAIAGVVAASAIVIATRDSSDPAGSGPDESTPAETGTPTDETMPPPKASEIEAECHRYQVDQKWNALRQCAARLKPLDPERATKLEVRAAEGSRSEERLAGVVTALRDRDLLRAKNELDHAWAGSIGYKRAKKLYDSAEEQAITALAAQLERMKDVDCKNYTELLTRERTTKPPRVGAAAASRTPCTPRPSCDVEGIAEKAFEQFRARDLPGSLASYDQALACEASPALAQKAFIVACNLNDAAKAKSYWKQLSPLLRQQAIGTCVRNGLTEELLNTP